MEILEFLVDVFGKPVLLSGNIDLLIPDSSLESHITRHYVNTSDWTNEYLLTPCGTLMCSQSRFSQLFARAPHPVARRSKRTVGANLNIPQVVRQALETIVWRLP